MSGGSSVMWVLAGLGNPGSKYDGTRHNIGFELADRFIARHGSPGERSKESFGGLLSTVRLGSLQIHVFKPQQYMNLSGPPVQSLLAFYKLKSDRLIVVHDEIDLPLGQLRVKRGGGDGGHNGLRSITEALSGPDYFRIRLGVGKPTSPDSAASRGDLVRTHVLTRFNTDEVPIAVELVERSVLCVETVIADGLKTAQNRFN